MCVCVCVCVCVCAYLRGVRERLPLIRWLPFYEVRACCVAGKTEYLVKWIEGDTQASSWELATHIHDPVAVASFEKGADQASLYSDWVWALDPRGAAIAPIFPPWPSCNRLALHRKQTCIRSIPPFRWLRHRHGCLQL